MKPSSLIMGAIAATGAAAEVAAGASAEWVIAVLTGASIMVTGLACVIRLLWDVRTDQKIQKNDIGNLKESLASINLWMESIDRQGCRAHGAEHRIHPKHESED